MIGICVIDDHKPIVEEFFQLFKTPWSFYTPNQPYDVVITDCQDISYLHASLIIVIDSRMITSFSFSESKGKEKPPDLLQQTNGPIFPVYTGVSAVVGGERLLTIHGTGQCVACRIEEETRSIIRIGFHLFAEVNYLLQNGQPLEHGHVPTMDIHISNLRKWITDAGQYLLEIPPCPKGSPFFVCLTHDVDFAGIRNHIFDLTMAGFVYRAIVGSTAGFLKGRYSLSHFMCNLLSVISLPFVWLGLKKDFWYQFQQYIKIENGRPSTFFFVPFKNRPGETEAGPAVSKRGVMYDVNSLGDEIEYLLQNGIEVGVHGIDSWIKESAAANELRRMKDITGRDGLGIRMHWLYNNDDTPAVLDRAGYKYDSTWGYNEIPGCRAGTFQVYKPLRTETLLSLPMHMMDTALFYPGHMNLTFRQGIKTIQDFADLASFHGGVLTLNWHHRSIAPERLWGSVYKQALENLTSRNARFSTASAIVDWFHHRRKFTFNAVIKNDEKINVNIATGDEAINYKDDFVLRLYIPARKNIDGEYTCFHDYPLQENLEVPIFH